ncbi:Outer membrane protein OmpA [Nitrosomonas marina]|uniref:Outer membrane protein OmpA n=1 Tax=Nitrosomonas marina TaxID=917 RepID=A0A1I0F1K4_9PROT|nr:DUF4157 domain-containing protein [Nitrosomonas marina]SET51881.1 Outer membrane protein OmpA [Nitrosomonas marina]
MTIVLFALGVSYRKGKRKRHKIRKPSLTVKGFIAIEFDKPWEKKVNDTKQILHRSSHTIAQASRQIKGHKKNGKKAPKDLIPRVLGNQAMLANHEFIQAKLKVGSPNDQYEQEADRVADQVMCMPDTNLPSGENKLQTSNITNLNDRLQRTCASCSNEYRVAEEESRPVISNNLCSKCRAQTKPNNETITPLIQRQESMGEEEETLQAKSAGQIPVIAPSVARGIQSLRGGGYPLPKSSRDFFESRFGHDFGRVRVHCDTNASTLARGINARAFTLRKDIVFGAGQYQPQSETGKRLIAHELTHVIQQNSSTQSGTIMRTLSCPSYEMGEETDSLDNDGILSVDARIAGSDDELIIQDFGINSAEVPTGALQTTAWQRAMSYIIGNPHIRIGIEGIADCHGDARHNLNLRQNRADAVVALLPPDVQNRIIFNFSFDPNHYLASNTTRAGRAQNRAVRIIFRSIPPSGVDPCDSIIQASNLDEYLFLVRCMEQKLGLTNRTHATTALSVLRQIYYGNASWSASQNRVWNFVIPNRPWTPGNDPRSALGNTLFGALQSSQVVAGIDLGHLMTGLDSMLTPQDVELDFGRFVFVTGLANEEWATWAGDVGSAAANFTLDTVYGTVGRQTEIDYYQRFASDTDMMGNLDAFAIRAAANPGGTPDSKLMRAFRPRGRLSEILLQYYRLTQTQLGSERVNSVRQFVEAYGGIVSGTAITNRAVLEANLLPSIEEFAGLFATQELLQRGPIPPGAPGSVSTLNNALTAMTRLFVDWLQGHL